MERKIIGNYKVLFDSNMLGVAGTDFEDRILIANDAFLSMIGYTRAELERGELTWSKISPSRYEDIDMEKVLELAEFQRIVPFQKEYIHKDGHSVPVLVGAEIVDPEKNLGVCFAIDISDLKRLEQKKDDFIGIVSHELKTPLAIMKLSADSLMYAVTNGTLKKKDIYEYAEEISSQVERLNILVTDLLNMARYEGERESIFQQSRFDARECADRAYHDVSQLTERAIHYTRSNESAIINGNRDRLVQVVINFLNNAIRFSESNTPIDLRIYTKDSSVCIEIEDRGVGIHPEVIDKIFDRFYRVDHPEGHIAKGTGIGLYVSNEIVKFHNGRITVDSTPGKGSIFTVELPLA